MIQQPPNLFPEVLDDPRRRFYLFGGLFLAFMALVSIATFWWIFYRVEAETAEAFPPAPDSPVYVNYDVRGEYIRPESLQAMQQYIEANPQPQAVQVLQGLTTAQISAYMTSQVSGGLKVDCSYCHNIANFAEEGNVNKTRARQMMLMSADLNQNHITKLPVSVGGYQVTCATCHNGRPQFQTYPIEIQNTLPNNFQLPLDLNYPGGLVVTGRRDKSNTEVELNQYTMYHMNRSLGQGCTFCHNARYFPSYEIDQKGYAIAMLQMSQHIQNTYVAPGGQLADGIMAGKTPSCYMCHQGARIPPGAAKPGQVPAVLSSDPPAQ